MKTEKSFTYTPNQRPIAFKQSTYLRGSTKGLKYPSCLLEHSAPKSVVRLFTDWTKLADETDSAIIPINLQHQHHYSNITAQRTIAWLTKHNLLVKKSVGVGRGNASRYQIRWSFAEKSLTERQRNVNIMKRTFATECYTPYLLKEKLAFLNRNECDSVVDYSDCSSKSSKRNFIKMKIDILFPKKQPKSVIERSVRYALYRIRQHTTNRDVITAAAKGLRQAMKHNKIFAGPDLNDTIDAIVKDDYNNKTTSEIYQIVNQAINTAIWGANFMWEMEHNLSLGFA